MQLDIKDIADKADMIINGYTFTKDNERVCGYYLYYTAGCIIEAMHVLKMVGNSRYRILWR